MACRASERMATTNLQSLKSNFFRSKRYSLLLRTAHSWRYAHSHSSCKGRWLQVASFPSQEHIYGKITRSPTLQVHEGSSRRDLYFLVQVTRTSSSLQQLLVKTLLSRRIPPLFLPRKRALR